MNFSKTEGGISEEDEVRGHGAAEGSEGAGGRVDWCTEEEKRG